MSYRGYDELRRGLVAHWPLSEGVGTKIFDTSQYANNGTIVDGTWVEGREGRRALGFDGLNDYVSISDDASLKPSDITVFLRFNPSNVDDNPFLIDKYDWTLGQIRGWWLGYNTQQLWLAIGNGTAHGDFKISEIPVNQTGKWYAIAFSVLNGEDISFYLNGELMKEETQAYVPSPTVVRIGGGYIVPREFAGIIDDIRIYNRALDAIELRNLYNLRGLI